MQHDGRKVRNPYVGNNEYHCFACDPNHTSGLRLEFFIEGDVVVSHWQPTAGFEGYPGVVHGGIQATLADEIAGWYLHAVAGVAGVTKEINVKYHAPARTKDGPFRIEARAKAFETRRADIAVSITGNGGKLLTTAECRYAIFSDAVARKRLHFPGIEAFVAGSDGAKPENSS